MFVGRMSVGLFASESLRTNRENSGFPEMTKMEINIKIWIDSLNNEYNTLLRIFNFAGSPPPKKRHLQQTTIVLTTKIHS